MTYEQIEKEALQLNEDERALLAGRLEESLGVSDLGDQELIAECERRWAAYQRGEMTASSAEEVHRRLREKLLAKQ